MHILFLLTQDLESPSGLGRYWPLARHLARLGHEMEIAALHPAWQSLESRVFLRDGVRVSYVAQMHVRREGNQLPGMSAIAVGVSCTPADVRPHVAVLGPAQLLKRSQESCVAGLAVRVAGGQRVEARRLGACARPAAPAPRAAKPPLRPRAA